MYCCFVVAAAVVVVDTTVAVDSVVAPLQDVHTFASIGSTAG